jgi:hypothetical protein
MESDLPYIDPEVLASLKAVVIVGNKTNNDSDRAIIKNLVDPDNPFIISNAAFKLNSGFGKYEEDFTDWRIYPNIKVTDSVVTTDGNFKSSWFIYKHSSESKINEMNIKVSGIPKGGKILYFYISDETANMPIAYTIPKDGIYHLPESKINNNRASVGFTVESSYDWNNIRIEQIPSFEGAFVTDGVDDLITSTKTVQEMLGGSNELTIVSMVHQVKDSANNVSFTNYIRGSANGYFRNIVNNYDKTGIYGYTSSDLMGLSVVNNILGDKNDYTSNGDNRDSIINGNFSVQGYSYNDGNNTGDFSSVAWYWTIIANKVLTTDQINQVIDYFNLDRTLNPDILCNTIKQGITNENHAEFGDKLIDFSGNGRDIQLNNLAWKGGSGIAAKQYETFKDWTNTPYQTSTVTEIDEFTRVVDSTSNAYWVSMINRTSDFDKVHDSINIVLYQDDMLLVHECKYKIDENVTTKALYETLKSGVNTITLATIDKFTDIPEDAEIMSLGEWVNPKSNKGSVKITLLPSYEGGVLLDGINDFVTIPTTVGGKQVLMKVNWQKSPTLLYDQRASGSFAVLTTLEDDAVNLRIAYQARNQDGKTYIDGIENNNIETYTLKDITHNITIANSSLGGIIVPVIGCNTGKSSNFAKMSLYDFMLFDNISTDDKIKELNEYVGIEGNTEWRKTK